MGCINGKHRTKNNTNAEDSAPINTATEVNERQSSSGGKKPSSSSKQTDHKQKNSKKDNQNNKKRKKKKDGDIKVEESSISSPSGSTASGGVLRRNAQNGSLSSTTARYSNPANGEDMFEINIDSAGSNTLPNYFNVAPDRLYKNFQDRLVGTQISRGGGQKLSDSQLEFFKMLDEKIAQGGEMDD